MVTVQLLSTIALQSGGITGAISDVAAENTFDYAGDNTPTSIVMVNTLWIISLGLSFSATFLSVLAKLRCRHYLRWHSRVTYTRRSNLVHQMRRGAKKKWRVSSMTEYIMALLVVSLVLFVLGLLVLVSMFSTSTLNVVVSVIVTSILLGVAVLKIFSVVYCSSSAIVGPPQSREAVIV